MPSVYDHLPIKLDSKSGVVPAARPTLSPRPAAPKEQRAHGFRVGGRVVTQDGFFAKIVRVSEDTAESELLRLALDVAGIGLRENVPSSQVTPSDRRSMPLSPSRRRTARSLSPAPESAHRRDTAACSIKPARQPRSPDTAAARAGTETVETRAVDTAAGQVWFGQSIVPPTSVGFDATSVGEGGMERGARAGVDLETSAQMEAERFQQTSSELEAGAELETSLQMEAERFKQTSSVLEDILTENLRLQRSLEAARQIIQSPEKSPEKHRRMSAADQLRAATATHAVPQDSFVTSLQRPDVPLLRLSERTSPLVPVNMGAARTSPRGLPPKSPRPSDAVHISETLEPRSHAVAPARHDSPRPSPRGSREITSPRMSTTLGEHQRHLQDSASKAESLGRTMDVLADGINTWKLANERDRNEQREWKRSSSSRSPSSKNPMPLPLRTEAKHESVRPGQQHRASVPIASGPPGPVTPRSVGGLASSEDDEDDSSGGVLHGSGTSSPTSPCGGVFQPSPQAHQTAHAAECGSGEGSTWRALHTPPYKTAARVKGLAGKDGAFLTPTRGQLCSAEAGFKLSPMGLLRGAYASPKSAGSPGMDMTSRVKRCALVNALVKGRRSSVVIYCFDAWRMLMYCRMQHDLGREHSLQQQVQHESEKAAYKHQLELMMAAQRAERQQLIETQNQERQVFLEMIAMLKHTNAQLQTYANLKTHSPDVALGLAAEGVPSEFVALPPHFTQQPRHNSSDAGVYLDQATYIKFSDGYNDPDLIISRAERALSGASGAHGSCRAAGVGVVARVAGTGTCQADACSPSATRIHR